MVVTQFAPQEEGLDPVSASQTTLETHMLPADLNVQPIANVRQRKHVKTCTVLTRVLKRGVATMLSAKLSTTFRTVSACVDTLGTPSLHVACPYSVSFDLGRSLQIERKQRLRHHIVKLNVFFFIVFPYFT